MKKLLIALLAAVLTSGAFAQDTAFPDIPANHWAADAVARITDLGIIIGFPDGTFRGNEAFTRYQTALVISRTLDVINNNVEAMGAMSAEDIAALNAALEQLASDLAAQGVRLAAAESDVASLGDDVIADGARIDDLEAAINGVMMNMVDPMVVQEMQDQIASLGVAAANAAAASAAADSGLQDQINALEVAIDAADAAASAAASAAAAAASQSAAADAELRQALAALSAAADAASAAAAAADSGLQDQIDALGAAAAAAAAASDAADAALSDAIAAASAAAADGDAELRRALAALSAAADAAAAASAAADAALSDAIAAAAAASAAALADAAAASDAGDAELRRALAALSAASDDADAGLQDQIDALGAAAAAAAAASDAADAALSDAIAAAAADAAAALADAAAASDAGDAELRRALAALSAASDDADAGLQDQIDALGAAAAAAAAASDAGDAALSDAIAALGAAADDAAAASAAADAGLQGQIDVLRVSVEAASARADAASARADAVAAAAAAARAALQGQIDALGAAATVAAAASEAADAELSDAIAAAESAAAAADAAAAAASEAADAELSDAIDAAAAAAAAADAAAAAAAAAADAGLQDQIDALAAAAAAAAAASEAADAALGDAINAAAADAAAADAAAAAESAAADAALSDAVDAAAAASEAADAALSDALDALSAAAAAAAAESAAADAALSDAVDAAAAASEAADAALSDALAAAAAAAAAADAAIRDEVAAAAAELQDQVHALGHDVEDAAAASEAADAALSDALAAAAAESAAADAGLGDSIAAAAAAAEVARAKLSDALAAASAAAASDAANNAAGVADNAGDIANVREFVILLRRNQVAIRDRVAALETADTEQDTAIEGLGNRIGVLESNLFDLSGSIDVSYKMVHATGGDAHFDIDRAFGDGFYRSGLSAISTGTQDDDDDGEIDRQANEDADIQGDKDGDVEVTLNVNLDFGNSLEGFAKLSLAKAPIIEEKTGADAAGADIVNPLTGVGYSLDTGEYYVIKVERVYTAATLGGMTDLEIVFGEDAGLSHGAYGSSFTGSDGINFRLVPGMIAFSPEISGFYVPNAEDGDGNTVAAAVQGLELRLSPMEGVSVGGHLSRWADGDTTTRDPVNALVVGFDAEVSLQIFDVAVEWNSASFSDDTSRNDDAFYVTLTVDDGDDMMMSIPLLSSLSASYFDVAEGWADLAQADDGNFPFKEDQAGLVANVGLDLVLVDLDGYVTSYRANSTQDAVLALGATATAPLFSGLSLEGSFRTASVTPQGGTAATVDDVDGRMDANESVVGGAGAASLERDKNYDTGFGITLNHDGMSADALISGLNLELGYSQTEADFSKRTINAGAGMTLPLDIITVTPYGSIEWVTDADADADEAEGNATTIKVGAGVTTQPIDTFLAPSLEGNVNYRNTSHVNTVSGNYTANELQFAVGLSLNEFLFDESVLKARYASYSGTNVKPNSLTADADDPATATYEVGTDANNGLTTATNGFELIWTYHGLELIYGSFTVDPDTGSTGDQSSANYFEIAYSVDF